ncbi:Peptide methionine sulfoxide reductase [Hypoxylon texense]
MSPFNGKEMFSHARSKLKQYGGLKRIIKKMSIRRLKKQKHDGGGSGGSGEGSSNTMAVVVDDQSSIDPPCPPCPSPSLGVNPSSSSSDDTDSEVSDANHALILSTGRQSAQGNSPLLLLPQELFDMITSYLDHAHVALLALVNKELMARFMRSCVKLGLGAPEDPTSYKMLNTFIKSAASPGMTKTKARGTLLSLIEYDLEDVVYCYKCKKIHSPFVSFMDRAYAPRKATRCIDWTMEHHMPSRATRKMLRTITKRRIHGSEYRYLLRQVNNTSTAYLKGIMAQITLRVRYRDDELLLRRQQVVSSIDKTALALWIFGQQLVDANTVVPSNMTVPRVYAMCNHRTWFSTYMPLIKQLLQPLCTASHPDHEGHSAACFSSEELDVSKQEGHMICERLKWLSSGAKQNPMDTPALLGDVLGCDKCTTDYSLDVISLPEPFRWGFVLTSWLDLGALDFSAKWDSHRDARPSREYKRSVYGDICKRFEDVESPRDFRPRIREIDLERMQNYGWGQRVADGKDRYIMWVQSHTCNPRTGWIEDPDPLEEADC